MTAFIITVFVILSACLCKYFFIKDELGGYADWILSFVLGPCVGLMALLALVAVIALFVNFTSEFLIVVGTLALFLILLHFSKHVNRKNLKEKFQATFSNLKPKKKKEELISPTGVPIQRSVYELFDQN